MDTNLIRPCVKTDSHSIANFVGQPGNPKVGQDSFARKKSESSVTLSMNSFLLD